MRGNITPRFTLTSDDGLADIRFDDGGMNLLSSDALRELSQTIDALPNDTRALLFASGHASVFAAGADMQEMRAFSHHDAQEFSRFGQELFDRIERLPFATAVFIDGDCFGGALDLALAFDLRFATSRARFHHPGARIGIVTGFGGTSRWRKVLARSDAHRLFLESGIKSAGEAKNIGLVAEIVERVDRATLRAIDPKRARMTKELLAHSDGLTLEQIHLLARKLEDLYSRAK